jgi:hypothetical protein
MGKTSAGFSSYSSTIEMEGMAECEAEEILRSGYRRGVFRYLVR